MKVEKGECEKNGESNRS